MVLKLEKKIFSLLFLICESPNRVANRLILLLASHNFHLMHFVNVCNYFIFNAFWTFISWIMAHKLVDMILNARRASYIHCLSKFLVSNPLIVIGFGKWQKQDNYVYIHLHKVRFLSSEWDLQSYICYCYFHIICFILLKLWEKLSTSNQFITNSFLPINKHNGIYCRCSKSKSHNIIFSTKIYQKCIKLSSIFVINRFPSHLHL